ncbi:MAG TPA: hypothetical protein PLI05_07440 [Methanotrichaceae archaeon]|nr:hypothetical protein [Methanotrichaceae archaeon]HQF16883.1 hypothetical protein [Methanotrichaceae archaeon]HQI91449.1 hypothetical protein [Methanotrichaceae archaeon]HQJ28772.1 hypothetical protein [Methanotrichaceae archaeon]
MCFSVRGQIVKKDLSIRVHDCPYCGLTLVEILILRGIL